MRFARLVRFATLNLVTLGGRLGWTLAGKTMGLELILIWGDRWQAARGLVRGLDGGFERGARDRPLQDGRRHGQGVRSQLERPRNRWAVEWDPEGVGLVNEPYAIPQMSQPPILQLGPCPHFGQEREEFHVIDPLDFALELTKIVSTTISEMGTNLPDPPVSCTCWSSALLRWDKAEGIR